MKALVQVFNNQPMTTSLAIAEGIDMEHSSVIKLVRKYINDLSDFKGLDLKSNPSAFETRKGEENNAGVAFETRPFETKGGNQWQEIALLNEGQAMFLLTLQRNTAKVVQFKKALVQAFLELRDQCSQHIHTFSTSNPQHLADLTVSADRTFRSILRASRACGMRLPQALRRANHITERNTGINMLRELEAEDLMKEPEAPPMPPHHRFWRLWLDGDLPVPCVPCRSRDFYTAYCHWCGLENTPRQPVNIGMARVVVPPGDWFTGGKATGVLAYTMQFAGALNDWLP